MDAKKFSFPDPLASDIDSPKFGLSWGKFISSYWFSGGYGAKNSWRFTDKHDEIMLLRTFLEGNVDDRQFDTLLEIDDDVSSRTYDRTVLSVMPHYINRVVDSMADSIYKVRARGTDRYSAELRDKAKDEKRKEMLFRDIAPEFNKAMGVDFPVNYDAPETEDELELAIELDFKTNYEIAQETCIERVFELNNYDEIANLALEDVTLFGEMCGRVRYDGQSGIAIDYVDPAHSIYSVRPTRTRDGRDMFYFGEVRKMHISELERQIKKPLSKEEKKAILQGQKIKDQTYGEDAEFMCEVLDFTVKTVKTKTYNKKYKRGGFKLQEKDNDWEPVEGMENRKVVEKYDTWYGGLFVIGTDLIYNWGQMTNMTVKRGVKRTYPPFVFYRLSVDPIGRRLMTIMKSLHIVHMKIQQLITSAKVSGHNIDIDAITEIDVGGGKILSPTEVIKIKNESGDLLYSGTNLEGDMNRVPMTPNFVNQLQELNELMASWNHYVSEANRITGINEYSSGTANLKGVLNQTSQAAINAFNTTIKHVFNAYFSYTRSIADNVMSRVQDGFIHGNINAIMSALIGKVSLKTLQSDYFKNEAQFTSLLELRPTDEEKAAIKETLDLAVQNQSISPEDALKIKMDVHNTKRAQQVISSMAKKRQRDAMQAEQHKIDASSQAKQQEILAQSQADMQKSQMELQGKIALDNNSAKNEAERIAFEMQYKFKYLNVEKQWDMRIANTRGGVDMQKEDRKDIRAAKEADFQSSVNATKNIDPTASTNLEEQEKIKKQLGQ